MKVLEKDCKRYWPGLLVGFKYAPLLSFKQRILLECLAPCDMGSGRSRTA